MAPPGGLKVGPMPDLAQWTFSHYCYLVKHLCQKKAINNNLQGSVATYLRCGGVIDNQIKKGLLLRLLVKKLKSVNIWESCK